MIVICISLVNLIVYLTYFRRATVEMRLDSLTNYFNFIFPKISVIIPAYNEADNICSCVISILNNTTLLSDKLEVWVVDDQSTDDTLNILNNLKEELNDSRLKILPGLPRPVEDVWIGKNWACTQGAEQSNGEFLLFIDADVQLKPKAIETVIQLVESEQIDLLNCIPAVMCECLAEWLVQPLIFINLLVSLNSKVVKDPSTKTAFAVGPFL
ncbi:MAG: glycosyltransferase family 2 protein, partial [Nostoc sp.]|uniref:glycosyltransferase family 2 protein n=1 Tax=Nostoc sp. TaxID=1180 RepID=UPI002FF4AFA3